MSDIAEMLLWCGLIMTAGGILGFASPPLLRFQNRWQAVPLLTSMVAAVGLARLLSPDPTAGDTIDVQGMGVIWIVAWLLLFWISLKMSHQALSSASSNGTANHQRSAPDRTPEEVDTITRAARRRSRIPEIADETEDVDGRLEEQYQRLARHEIDLHQYRDAVLAEQAEIEERLADLNDGYEEKHRDLYDIEVEQIEADEAQCRWRLDWIDRQLSKQQVAAGAVFPDTGTWARFEYVNAHGEVSNRHIVHWAKRGIYIVGFDKDRGEERTFRQDRIIEWTAG